MLKWICFQYSKNVSKVGDDENIFDFACSELNNLNAEMIMHTRTREWMDQQTKNLFLPIHLLDLLML